MAECVLRLLATYLEELEALDLKKFKLYLGTSAEVGKDKIPWGRMEKAGPLEMAQLLVAHHGSREAWQLALSIFNWINRKDLWEKGQKEDLVRDPAEAYRDNIRRKFRLMEDRNARLGECVNLSHRYTRLLLVKEHSNSTWAKQKLLATGQGHTRTVDHLASPIQIETLFEPDEERPEPPHTVVLQGAAGMGKSILAHKVMLDWADGTLFQGRFDFLFYINCREMNQKAERSLHDLISSCWPEQSVPLLELVRVPERLLFIIDGFDELKPSFHHPQGPWCFPWQEKQPTELLLTSLIRKKLLPESSLLITTRPTALEKLHRLLEHPRHVEILGFSEAERKEYFYKYFHSMEQANQVLNFVRDNEPLFTMCFVPMVCWVVCTCLKQQLEDGGLVRQTSRTTTALYTLYLLSLMQPKPGTPTHQAPPHQKGLCSLAADGLWSQKVLFEKQDLQKHGLDGMDVSAFLNMNIFQKDINYEKFYSFIHLSFQEFFAAMYYILDSEDSVLGPEQDVSTLLVEYGSSDRSFLAPTVRFIFGLLNEETRSYFEKNLCWKVSPQVKMELLKWIHSKAQSEGSTLQQGSLELLSCLYEIQEETFIQQALSPFQMVVVSKITTKMEHIVSSFCMKSCKSVLVVHLYGVSFSEDEDDGVRGTSGFQPPLAQLLKRCRVSSSGCQDLAAALMVNRNLVRMDLSCNQLGLAGVKLLCEGLRHPTCRLQMIQAERNILPNAYSEHLAAALCTNPNLVELVLCRNALGSQGVKMLCQGLRHPNCKLQNLRLRKCHLEAGACQEMASVLSTNQHLLELDLTGNALEDLGLRLLCPGLKHPACRLQTLWLKICHLTAVGCEDLASALSRNQSLRELDLSLNDLGDPGVLLLCKGLSHPTCKLQTLRLGICRLGSAACEGLSTLLQTNHHLRELDLSFNDLGDPGMGLLCEGLRHPTCRLQKLWLFGMDLNKATHRELAALRVKQPNLDIGC
ncbi:PREDICTED: NACHT, LRR and PYD domains-containing protein 12 [Elephantulus edwardii]|uniref:NACHT, LRR and PYD domains-containing protein 12 n=1 Tax=Elephantulus edwardii TaxID=28737 RepID=UPI0003F0D195|nr:PREDICTED: NACHT, LRR and PYD domains-containing protein 12 [Elephantulus edwardii]